MLAVDPTQHPDSLSFTPSHDLSDTLVHLNSASFPLPHLGPKVTALANKQLRPGGGGRGFQLLRGLPMDKWTKVEALIAYMGVAAHMGYNFSPQGKDGRLVHHIKVLNGGGKQCSKSPQSAAMGFHSDAQVGCLPRLVGLLLVKPCCCAVIRL